MVGRRALLRPARTGAGCSRRPRRRSPPRSSASSTTKSRTLCAMVTDWETTQRLQGPAAARVAVHQGQGLPRHDHPEGVRRPGLLRVRAFAGDHQAVDALGHGGGDRDGAELARAGRAARCTTAPTSRSATTCRASRRASRSRASRSPIRTRARTRRRFPTTASSAGASTRASACSACRVTWDKRYITLGPVATLLGLAFRAYDPDQLVGDTRGPRHHLRADSRRRIRACDIGRRHMPLNAVFQNGPNSGPRRVHPDGLGHRRPADARHAAGGC